MKILFLSRWFPYPTNNGSKLRIYNLLRGLAKHHDATLLSFADQPDVSPDAPEIRKICSDVYVVPWREFDPNSTRARFGFMSFAPRFIIDTFSAEMADKITQLIGAQSYDLVIASQLSMAAYRSYFENTPAIFEEVEIGLSYGEVHHSSDMKQRLRHALTWFKLRMYLSHLLDSFQACTVASVRERQLLTQNIPRYKNQIEIIPNSLSMDEYKNIMPEKKGDTLIFTGSFKYHTNYESMVWFVADVFPLILEQLPETQLIITGDHAGLSLPSIKNITLVGHVDDIKTLVASCSVSIAPLLNGGGTRLKILEAMALGTPVVATSKGVEGLDVLSGKHFLLADVPVEFANCVIRLLKDEKLRVTLIKNAGLLVREKYDLGTVLSNYLRLIDTIA